MSITLRLDSTKFPANRLAELVVHIAAQSENDPFFASTKLNKLLWKADFKAFCETGRTISGANYQKLEFGPAPKPMPIVLDRLKESGRIEWHSKPAFKKQKRPCATSNADLSGFSNQEIALVNKVINENVGKSGSQMSDESHGYLAWQVAEKGEAIPFAAWLIRSRKPTASERAHGLALAARLSRENVNA
jgi:Antitoxin SocA-like, Panacea domain